MGAASEAEADAAAQVRANETSAQRAQDKAVLEIVSPLRGLGNIGGGRTTEPGILNGGLQWLGPNYREIAPGVFRSEDGMRQFRMTNGDLLGAHGELGPHAHFETIGPNGRTIEENSHVGIIP